MKTITDITPVQKKESKIRLAAYCRVSSNSEDQLHSYATQIRYYSNYTKQHTEYELVDIYADEGLTGTELEKREDLSRLLKDCKNGKVDRIIVKSISRFARNTEELLEMIRALKDIGVSVYFEEQGIDTTKINAEMIVTFPGMVAQQESMTISGNLRWGIQKRMKAGEFICSNPAYGYALVNGKMEINENEAQVVRRIFELYLQGYGTGSIANVLNEEKVPKRNGKVWRMTGIQYILKNEKYIGDALLQKKYTTDTLPYRQKENKGERTQYYVENYNSPIISKEDFQRVQKLLNSKEGQKNPMQIKPLSRIMRCPICGAAFRRQEIAGKEYWFCAMSDRGKENCISRRVRAAMVYDAFTNMLYKMQTYRKAILETLIQRIEYLSSTSDNHIRIRQIDKELADLSAQNHIITKLNTNGILSASDFATQTAEINNKMLALRKERKKKLTDDEGCGLLDELRLLNELLKEYKPNGRFDEQLFEQIIDKIIVVDSTQLKFHLIGGVILTEPICEKGRCDVA